jgi:hypothetical protein
MTMKIRLFVSLCLSVISNDLSAVWQERSTSELQEKAHMADISVDGCADVRVSHDVVTVTSKGAVSFVRLRMKELNYLREM